MPLSWVVRAGASIAVGPSHPWENSRTAAARSEEASALFCVREFVFPSHPLINCYIDFCGFTLHVMKLW